MGRERKGGRAQAGRATLTSRGPDFGSRGPFPGPIQNRLRIQNRRNRGGREGRQRAERERKSERERGGERERERKKLVIKASY